MSHHERDMLKALWMATGSLYTGPAIEGMVQDVRAAVEADMGPLRPGIEVAPAMVAAGEDDGTPSRIVPDGATYAEIGAALGISADRARQIEQRALRKARRAWIAAYGNPFPHRDHVQSPQEDVGGTVMLWPTLATMCGAYALAAE